MVEQPDMVWLVRCIETGCVHIFSSLKRAQEYISTTADEGAYVVYEYMIDCPERHEGAMQ